MSVQQQIILQEPLVPCNIEERHWLGVLFEITVDHIVIVYLDSENQELPIILRENIVEQLQRYNPGKEIVFNKKLVEQQRYNNCGPELIENFVYYLIGSRATQEAAVYVHSLLLENTLLDPVEYALKISENNKLIGFISNRAPLMVDRPITGSNGLSWMSMQQAEVRSEMSMFFARTCLSELPSTYTKYLDLEKFDHTKQMRVQQIIAMLGDLVLLALDEEVSSKAYIDVSASVQNIGSDILPIKADFTVVSSTALVAITNSGYDSSKSSQGQGSGLFTFIHRVTDIVTSTLNNGLMNIGSSIMDVIMKNNYIKHQLINYVYHNELLAINTVINKPYIQSSVIPDVKSLLHKHPLEWSKNDFKKIKLIVHPDKGGNDEDFRAVDEFQKQIEDKEQMYQNLLPKLLPNIQTIIYKSNIGFKAIDTVVDSGRLIYEPTFQNVKKVVFDSAYLYSMYQGINGVSALISGSEAMYQTYYGEYTQAFQTVATTIGYMALPSLIAYTTIPYLGLAYGIGMVGYTGYSAITNANSFYLERTSDVESVLRSTMAYRDLAQALSKSPLQQLYDFTKIAKEYEVELNNIVLVAEKEALKIKLVEENGDFGQKLYDYIYGSLLEEKYSLLNQVLQGVITEDETKSLKAKHIKITLDEQSYEHCMEIRNIEANINSSSQSNRDNGEDSNADVEHYYCYDDKHKMLDHVLIGDNHFEVIERL